MKKIVFSTLTLLIMSAQVYSQTWLWTKKVFLENSSSNSGVSKMITDNSENIYITGNFNGTVYIDNDTLTSGINGSVFVAKFDSSGSYQWSTHINASGMDLTVDNNGNSYLTGEFSDTVFLNNDTIIPQINDAFVAKVNSTGNFTWFKGFGGKYGNGGNSISTDDQNNVYACGWFQDSATFANDTLIGPGYFILKYASDGSEIWGIQTKNGWAGGSCSISTDDFGNSYISGKMGSISLTVPMHFTEFDSLFTGVNNLAVFLAKYDQNGSFLWAKQSGINDSDLFNNNINIDDNGNILSTGTFQGNLNFDTISLNSNGDINIYTAKHTSSGNIIWAKNAGGPNPDRGQQINSDTGGNIFVTGFFQGSANFDSYTLSSLGFVDFFIAKLNSDGDYNWVIQGNSSSSGYSSGLSVVPNNMGKLYVLGEFTDTLYIGDDTLISSFERPYIGKLYDPTITVNTERMSSVQKKYIKVFPNPFNQYTTISVVNDPFLSDEPLYLSIYNLLGSELIAKRIKRHKTKINRGNLKSGVYLFKLRNDSEVLQSGKIIIE